MQSTIKSAAMAAIMLLSFISATTVAQTSKFSLSVNSLTTNFNYGKSNSALDPHKKNFRGFQAGVSYQVGLTPMFSIVPELYFAMKGGTLKENNPITGGRSTLRINSLEMPVLARLHCNRLFLNAGPYVGYNVGGRLKTEGTETLPGGTTRLSFGNSDGDFKRWDFGLQAGAGYSFSLKQSTLTVGLRYGYGLVNISHDVERYNRTLNISVQVSKPGKKSSGPKQG